MKKITVIGTGYVGLVSGTGLSDFGHQVTCCDIDEKKITALKNGQIPIYEPGLEEVIKRNIEQGRLVFTTELAQSIRSAEVVFIAVGTPQSDNGEADISAVLKVAEEIGQNLNRYKVVCTKSTVPVGTGQQVSQIIRENSNGSDQFGYVSNPEFLREGAAVKDFLWPDRVVIGADSERSFNIMKDVYRPLYINETPIVHTTIATAETIKYASNAFLAMKITFINEVANLCEAVNADVHQVAKAMGLDGRISAKFLHPGPGYGGSCFPKDTNALVSIAEKAGVEIATIKATIDANEAQKQRMVDKLRKLAGGDFTNRKIAVLGLAFKPQTDDVRDSAAIIMLRELYAAGADVTAYDPVAAESMRALYPDLNCADSWQAAVADADAAVIMTEWNEFRAMDLKMMKSMMKTAVLLDTRNIIPPADLERLGFKFDNVGRQS